MNKRPGEAPRGIYKTYKWPLAVLAANVRAGRLTPMFEFTPDQTDTNNISCGICYNFFPKMNQTVCCANHICTECIAACVQPPNREQMCPFCRKTGFFVTPNLASSQLKNPDGDDSQYVKFEKRLASGFDSDDAEGCSDEAIAIALQFGWDVKEVNKKLDSGMSVEEVIQAFAKKVEQAVVAPPAPPTPTPTEVPKREWQDGDFFMLGGYMADMAPKQEVIKVESSDESD